MRLAYRADGPETAPALLLSGSLGTTTELWDRQVAGLRDGFRLVRYDHPGHGASPAPVEPLTVEGVAADVVTLLDRLRLERVSFCGLSLGGMVGMALALEAPERLDRLVLCCTAAHLGPADAWYERARRVRAGGTAAIADHVLARWFTDRFRQAHPTSVAQFRTMLETIPRAGYAACCEAIAQWDARERLGGIVAPTLVIAGAEDVATTPEAGAFLAEAIPDAELVVLPGAAHLANVEQPEPLLRAVLEHLQAPSSSEALA